MRSLKTYRRLVTACGVMTLIIMPLILVIASIMSIVQLASVSDPTSTKMAIGLLLISCMFLPGFAAMWPGFLETIRTEPPD